MNLTDTHKKELLQLARQTIARGCQDEAPPEPSFKHQPDIFTLPAATFVTLQKNGQLRGCIGSLEAHRALWKDVINNAFASAFRDHRFPSVKISELEELQIEISILTPQKKMDVSSEEELLQTLVPNIDGLVIQDRNHSATFLPQVWEQLPDPQQFLNHLRKKAGLPARHWSDSMACFRYRCIKFTE